MDNVGHGDWFLLLWTTPRGLFLINFRRVALAVVLLSGLIGLISRLAGWNEAAFADPSLNLKHIAAGQNVGPFVSRRNGGARFNILAIAVTALQKCYFLDDFLCGLAPARKADRIPLSANRMAKHLCASRASIHAGSQLSVDGLHPS